MKEQFINDQYSDHFASSIRNRVKQLYLWIQQANFPKNKFKNNLQFLYGHHLFGDEEENLIRVIDFILANFKVISYSEAVNRLQHNLIDDQYICFSFDDGIRNTMRIAQHFAERNISAMFFLNPLVVDNAHDASFTAEHSRKRLNKKPLEFMDWKDVSWLQHKGHEIGNHTLSHINLGKSKLAELPAEIELAKEKLEERCGPIKHFAWPYGLRGDINSEAFRMVIKSGHHSVASAIRGQHFSAVDLREEIILRDQLVYKDPLYFFTYFYARNNAQTEPTQL